MSLRSILLDPKLRNNLNVTAQNYAPARLRRHPHQAIIGHHRSFGAPRHWLSQLQPNRAPEAQQRLGKSLQSVANLAGCYHLGDRNAPDFWLIRGCLSGILLPPPKWPFNEENHDAPLELGGHHCYNLLYNQWIGSTYWCAHSFRHHNFEEHPCFGWLSSSTADAAYPFLLGGMDSSACVRPPLFWCKVFSLPRRFFPVTVLLAIPLFRWNRCL